MKVSTLKARRKAYRKSGTQESKAGPQGWTLRWDPKVGP